MKILIIALSGIGDALMFTPALKLLRNQMPDGQIDVLVMYKGSRDIYKNNPNLDNVYQFNFLKEGVITSLKYISQLRGKYDTTINVYPSNRKEYNIISFLIGAKNRAAVKYLRKDYSNLGFLNSIRITENDSVHNVEINIKLIEKLLNKKFDEDPTLELFITEEDKIRAQKFFSENNILSDNLVIGFHPGCATLKNHIKRRWEPEKFAELGKKLIDDHNAKILVFGGPDEGELKNSVKVQIDSQDAFVVNTNRILQSAAIMKSCDLFVTNDSSQMHIAAAHQLKVVAIIGPTNPHYIHPWKTEHKIVTLNLDCAPCFFYSPRPLICIRDDVQFKCIKELTVDMVYDAVINYL
ncbi:MAG: glycosyltransferase family 9 protein [Ignavibacteria bacterium]|nr:glycosyltransferase family 9 protein [Ignavibacteria bacterium]